MKLMMHYGTDAVLLPATVIGHLNKASKRDIAVLMTLAADPAARLDLSAAVQSAAKALLLSEAEVETSLAFWRGTGVIATEEGEAPVAVNATAPKESAPAPKVISDRGMPVYSTEELGGVLERQQGLADLIDACQHTFGKIFNTGEVSIIAGMVGYLGFDGEFVLLLLSHCVRMEKKSLRYAEKMALSLHDEGVTEVQVLEERLHRIEVMASGMGKIRAMFGISSRSLTSKEKAVIEGWLCNMAYGEDVLKLAYEITVDSIGKASIPYANSILERWYAEGYRTLEDVEKAIAEYRRQKNSGNANFDVDDFLEAALKRSFGE